MKPADRGVNAFFVGAATMAMDRSLIDPKKNVRRQDSASNGFYVTIHRGGRPRPYLHDY